MSVKSLTIGQKNSMLQQDKVLGTIEKGIKEAYQKGLKDMNGAMTAAIRGELTQKQVKLLTDFNIKHDRLPRTNKDNLTDTSS